MILTKMSMFKVKTIIVMGIIMITMATIVMSADGIYRGIGKLPEL